MGNWTSSKKIQGGDLQENSNVDPTAGQSDASNNDGKILISSKKDQKDGATSISQKNGKGHTRMKREIVRHTSDGRIQEFQESQTNKKENGLTSNHPANDHKGDTFHSDDERRPLLSSEVETEETIQLYPTDKTHQHSHKQFTTISGTGNAKMPSCFYDIPNEKKRRRKKKRITEKISEVNATETSYDHESNHQIDTINNVVAALADLCKCNGDRSKVDSMQLRGYGDLQGHKTFLENISVIENYVTKGQSDVLTGKHANCCRQKELMEKHISALVSFCQSNGYGPRINATDFTGSDETEVVMKQILYVENYVKKKNEELTDARSDVQHYMNRLSEQAGDMLCYNNPSIANLSDEKRPTKLAEEYKSLYDNEWTDVMEEMEEMEKSRKTDQRRRTYVLHLYAVLKSVYLCCKQKAEQQIEGVAKHLFLLNNYNPSHEQIIGSWNDSPEQKLITDYRKSSAEERIAFLQKTIREDDCFLQQISSCEDLDNGILMHILNSKYFDKCIELCWLFVIQTPPVFLGTNSENGNTLDRELYSEYTRAGKVVDYVVWPVLYLEKDGPILAKGVAQPQRCSERK